MRQKAVDQDEALGDGRGDAKPVDGQVPGVEVMRRWAALIQRVYEVDPLTCTKCGGRMRVISFIERRQREVIEQILRHCGLWDPLPLRGPPSEPPAGTSSMSSDGRQFEPDGDYQQWLYTEGEQEV